MTTTKILSRLSIILFALVLSTSMFAQDKPKTEPCKEDCKMECCTKEAKHVCNDECKTKGCAAKADKACCSKEAKHVCNEECKTNGCTAKAEKEAKHVCNDECKENGCTAMKVSYECPMKCEPASDKPGECSKCGMELKKKA